MITPLDPVIAQIIPLPPLRNPDTMPPQSARDALRALAAARAAIPPPVRSTEEMEVMGGRRAAFCSRLSRLSGEVADRRLFHGGGWVAGDLETQSGRPVCSQSKQGPSSSPSIIAVRRKRDFPARSRMLYVAAVRDVFERIAEFGGDNMRVGVAGDSAGGNLAAAVAIDALRAAGVSTKRHPGLIHGYFGMGEASEAARPEAQRARADFKAMLERGA